MRVSTPGSASSRSRFALGGERAKKCRMPGRIEGSGGDLHAVERVDVKTIYDLVTMVIFAGLVVLFLQRSTAPEPRDHMYQYAPPAIGCAVANYMGNQGQDWVAVIIIVAVVGYILYVLKPFNQAL
jgi:hypothetical protein